MRSGSLTTLVRAYNCSHTQKRWDGNEEKLEQKEASDAELIHSFRWNYIFSRDYMFFFVYSERFTYVGIQVCQCVRDWARIVRVPSNKFRKNVCYGLRWGIVRDFLICRRYHHFRIPRSTNKNKHVEKECKCVVWCYLHCSTDKWQVWAPAMAKVFALWPLII